VTIIALMSSVVPGATEEANAEDFNAAAEILCRECISCHGGDLQISGLRLDRREDALSVIEPGHSDAQN
jgi:hypothetical protein